MCVFPSLSLSFYPCVCVCVCFHSLYIRPPTFEPPTPLAKLVTLDTLPQQKHPCMSIYFCESVILIHSYTVILNSFHAQKSSVTVHIHNTFHTLLILMQATLFLLPLFLLTDISHLFVIRTSSSTRPVPLFLIALKTILKPVTVCTPLCCSPNPCQKLLGLARLYFSDVILRYSL